MPVSSLYICFFSFFNTVHFDLSGIKNTISSVPQSCPTLCNPMDCSTPGFPFYHQLPELAQTHVHRVSDAIQPSHPLSSPSPPAFSLRNICNKDLAVVPRHFGTRDWFPKRQFFHGPGVGGRWFQDDSSAFHLLCTLFQIKCPCQSAIQVHGQEIRDPWYSVWNKHEGSFFTEEMQLIL